MVRQIVEYIQTSTGLIIDERVYVSSEDRYTDNFRMNKKKAFREIFEKNNFKIDMREMQTHYAFCKNRQGCSYAKGRSEKGFSFEMQREVDIAIAMRPIKAKKEHPTMKNLILVTGDGDFTDMIKFMKNTLNVKVFIVAWFNSVNWGITELAETIYLDELFDSISVVNPGGTLTNADRLKQEPLFANFSNKDALIEAAIHKYPETHDYKNCLMFAIKLIS